MATGCLPGHGSGLLVVVREHQVTVAVDRDLVFGVRSESARQPPDPLRHVVTCGRVVYRSFLPETVGTPIRRETGGPEAPASAHAVRDAESAAFKSAWRSVPTRNAAPRADAKLL